MMKNSLFSASILISLREIKLYMTASVWFLARDNVIQTFENTLLHTIYQANLPALSLHLLLTAH